MRLRQVSFAVPILTNIWRRSNHFPMLALIMFTYIKWVRTRKDSFAFASAKYCPTVIESGSRRCWAVAKGNIQRQIRKNECADSGAVTKESLIQRSQARQAQVNA